jgi:predicted Zn-dependent protease
VLARGIAHTALRSVTRLMTLENLANVGSIPLIYIGSNVPPTDGSKEAIPMGLLGYRRRFELDADYFGVQYAYKAGYDPESFVHFVERTEAAIEPLAQALRPFPQTSVRLKALHEEIADVLPKRDAKAPAAPEFDMFKKRLRDWKPAASEPTPTEQRP